MRTHYHWLRVGLVACWIGTAVLAEEPSAPVAAAAPASPALTRIVELLRERYVDRDRLSPQMLEEASLNGIIESLGQGAVLLSAESAAADPAPAVDAALSPTNGHVARAEIIEPGIGYIRLGEVNRATIAAVDEQLRLFAEAKVDGYILDLRFANGEDYRAAAELAGRFLRQGEDLFILKSATRADEVFRSVARADAPSIGDTLSESPLLLLVNGRTRGSAEALAGGLRAHDRGILIGGITAGSAVGWEDVDLGDGRVLRVATAKIVLHPNQPNDLVSSNIFPNGLAPDVFVPAELSVEQEVLFNAPTNVTLTVSLQPAPIKKRLSEADLVKAFRGEALPTLGLPASGDGEEVEDGAPSTLRIDEPLEAVATEEGVVDELAVVRDVVLQRAVDVMKGIRVLLTWK